MSEVDTVYEVADIEEAVELANEFRDNGTCDWFRGQTRPWPPYSSLFRLRRGSDVEASIAARDRRLAMFLSWLNKIPELRYLLEPEHDHSFFAIIQHYGIPTDYIDFSTDPGVAGFFAADTETPPDGEKSCIYCLDSKDLMEVWNFMKDLEERKGASVDLIRIEVQNLWRLQAQRGVFLFANWNWEIDYPMDKIVFPYSGYPSYPTAREIYPTDKSPLEQLLDQYFSLEQSSLSNERTRKMFEELKKGGVAAGYHEWEAFPGGFFAEAFLDSAKIAPSASWDSATLEAWNVSLTEDYHEAVGPTLPLQIKAGAEVEAVRKSVAFGITQALRSNPALRSKTVNWSFTGLPETLSQESLYETLRPVWNGMRRLPFKNREIGHALAAVVVLFILSSKEQPSSDAELTRFSQCFGDCIEVGFSNYDGSGSRGVAARATLHNALRKDMSQLLRAEFQDRVDNVRDLFGIIYNPKLMFEWDEFKSLFAREVIPAQALKQRKPILFNPAQLITFGLP